MALSVLIGTLTGVSAAAQENDTGPGNRALIDDDATGEALDAATSLSEDLFTFTHTDLDAHKATFARLTTGDFSREYSAVFDEIVTQARSQQLSVTSTVRDAAVRLLNGDDRADDWAKVLVFLDQTGTAGATNAETTSHAMFSVTVERVDGEWKVAGIDLYEDR